MMGYMFERVENIARKRENTGYQHFLLFAQYYGRPLFQARLLPNLNTIPNNSVKENSLSLSSYGIGFSTKRHWFKSCPNVIFLLHLFISFFVTDFVREMRARPGLAVEPLISFNVQ